MLFTWIRILRVRWGRRSSHSSMPPGPLCAQVPMSRARFRESPRRIISSSVQNVPSTRMQAADRMLRQTSSSIAPSPGA